MSSKHICAHCNKPINEAVVVALGKSWHKEHFLCAHCKQPLKDAKYIQEDGKPYCEKDWKALFQTPNQPKCAQCNSPIQDTVVTAMGKTWHKDHFVCTHCKKPFKDSKFLTENGLPYCEADHKALFQKGGSSGAICAQCNKPIADTVTQAMGKSWHKEHFVCTHCKKPFNGSSFFVQDEKPYCEDDHKKLFPSGNCASGSNPLCAHCNKPITDTVLTALGKHWHKDHFVCAHCKKPITEAEFSTKDGQAYCEKDYTALFRKKCSGCGELIKDTVLTALDKHWHKQCFSCNKCKKPINAQQGFTEKNGMPFCMGCGV
ncbi:leupaxin-like [Macrosteles quadrilineatus]|uniref:leupaxin-like n=1 Tax=Macrosteles quadrilineatus TaxID=74068 RepID=UPI0023E10CCF|nr:leupaxin-like [Macrosteles quadrilineatus]